MKHLILQIFIILAIAVPSLAQNFHPKVIKYKAPEYPAAARATRTQGEVMVAVKIDKDGSVISAKVESGHPLLRKACEIVSNDWTFVRTNENKVREAKLIFSFRINTNKSSKNNYRNPKIKTKFKKPNQIEIIELEYPRIDI
jgi:TonB family protein